MVAFEPPMRFCRKVVVREKAGELVEFGRQLLAAKKRKDDVTKEPKRQCHV
jgi:hypothetical protein